VANDSTSNYLFDAQKIVLSVTMVSSALSAPGKLQVVPCLNTSRKRASVSE